MSYQGTKINPTKYDKSQVKFIVVLVLLAIFMALPIVYIFVTAFKPLNELFAYPPRFTVRRPTLENFARISSVMEESGIPITRYLANSLFSALIVVVCTISRETGHVVAGPDVVSRGFVYVRESEPLLDDARALVNRILNECADNGVREWGTLKTKAKDALSRLLYDRTRRSPMILPIIMEV